MVAINSERTHRVSSQLDRAPARSRLTSDEQRAFDRHNPFDDLQTFDGHQTFERQTRFALGLAALLIAATTSACKAEVGSSGSILSATGSPSATGGTPSVGVSGSGGAPAAGASSGTGGTTEPEVELQASSRFGLAVRLSKFEYTNSISDVLGVSLLPEELDETSGGIPNDTGDGVFKHLADNQTSVEQHALAYFQVAESVAQRADIAKLSLNVGACSDATEDCGTAFIKGVGQRLYRRPLNEREVQAMLSVYDAGTLEQFDHTEAARWTLIALLQAPQFLFRTEDEVSGVPEQRRDLTGYELAAKLAAFLWVSVPDDALLRVAADNSLLTPSVLDAQVTRMLSDPKARRFTEVFATDFSRARFSSFDGSTDADRDALNESIVATFQDHFWTQQGSIADLFTTTRYVVNPTVAALLGVTTSGGGLEPIDVSQLPQRVGLMSHPGMIAGMGDRAVGSFVNRGKYLMERLLCRHPIAFPADITTQIDQFNADTTGLNERERAEVRMTRTECWACHAQFEPLAFGFARFDGAGRYVGEMDPDGKPLPLDGWVPTGEAQVPRYEDVQTYMEILAKNPVIQTCMTEHFLDFATSRIGDEVGHAESEKIGEEYLAHGSTLTAMVSAVVHSPLFQTIVTSPASQEP